MDRRYALERCRFEVQGRRRLTHLTTFFAEQRVLRTFHLVTDLCSVSFDLMQAICASEVNSNENTLTNE